MTRPLSQVCAQERMLNVQLLRREHIEAPPKQRRKSGSRVVVPPVLKLKDVVSSSKLGVLSADVRMFAASMDGEILVASKYFAQKEVGGNPTVIGVGHGKLLPMVKVWKNTLTYY